MAKFMISFTVALLLSFVLASTARPDPSFPDTTFLKTQHNNEAEKIAAEEDLTCEGVGTEECLTRRTLAAHLDYIYTQEHKP
ncbi:Phytosulfokine [Trema orientale]|uniref:Phytosulfokine n=1 Tax=Trema orientale TaxID=63057 RepID=A0A2P5G0Y4_TREOI|nr:Phytosulfokine [Trema orientale]